MMGMNDGFEFIATVYKVSTLVDNGIRLTLDLPETAIPQMALLAECQREGLALRFTAVDVPAENVGRYSHYKKR